MKRRVVGFIGPSKSGKTALILKLAKYLQAKDYKVCTIKHDAKDQAEFDKKGKDSELFFRSGFDTAVISPKRTTIFQHTAKSIDSIVKTFDNFDYLFVEGFSNLPIPHIAICGEKLEKKYLDKCNALICTSNCEKIYQNVSLEIQLIDKNDIEYLSSWIDRYGEKYDYDIIAPL